MTDRTTGRVKYFDSDQRLGSIVGTHSEKECLVRHSALRGTILGLLAEGERVEFQTIHGAFGASARDVVRVG